MCVAACVQATNTAAGSAACSVTCAQDKQIVGVGGSGSGGAKRGAEDKRSHTHRRDAFKCKPSNVCPVGTPTFPVPTSPGAPISLWPTGANRHVCVYDKYTSSLFA